MLSPYWFINKVCFWHQYLQFKPTYKSLRQFWFFQSRGGGGGYKTPRVQPIKFVEKIWQEITNMFGPVWSQPNTFLIFLSHPKEYIKDK